MKCKIFDACTYETDQGAMNALLDEGFVPADILTIYELIHQGEIPPATTGSGFVNGTTYVSGVIASEYRGEMRMALPRELRNLSGIKGFMIGCQAENLRVFLGPENFSSTNRFVGVRQNSPRHDGVDGIIERIGKELERRTLKVNPWA